MATLPVALRIARMQMICGAEVCARLGRSTRESRAT